MLANAILDRREQLIRGTRLAQESIDVPLIDGGNCRLEVGLTAQDHSDRIGLLFAHLRQKLSAVHDGHAHVGDDQCKGTFFAQHAQPFDAATGCFQINLPAETTPDGIHHLRFIVYE